MHSLITCMYTYIFVYRGRYIEHLISLDVICARVPARVFFRRRSGRQWRFASRGGPGVLGRFLIGFHGGSQLQLGESRSEVIPIGMRQNRGTLKWDHIVKAMFSYPPLSVCLGCLRVPLGGCFFLGDLNETIHFGNSETGCSWGPACIQRGAFSPSRIRLT